jgi:predicted N-formylglutamate amidohydrolase
MRHGCRPAGRGLHRPAPFAGAKALKGAATADASHASGLVVSCEHGGHEVPPAYARLFAGQQALLESHQGWDPGTLELARQMARTLEAPLHAATTTRLLVDLNRSIGNRQLFSELCAGLERSEREAILAAHYRPHRDAIEHDIAARIAAGRRVVHVAVHSFTPVLGGRVRHADVSWLYDPRRKVEADLVQRWLDAFARRDPALLLRRNYPYRGSSDGLTRHLRERLDTDLYLGIELEVNQRLVDPGAAPWDELRRQLIDTLAEVMRADAR